MRSLSLSICLILVAGYANGQEVRRRSVPPPKVEMQVEGIRLPMSSRGGRSVVEARVNGKGPFAFYFDTGASGPVISQKLANELMIPVIGEVQVKSGGDAADKKPMTAQLVRIDKLDLGLASLSEITCAAMDRGKLEQDGEPMGVLSPAMFPGYLVTLDYPNKEIRIAPGELGAPDDKTIFAYVEDRMIPSLMVTVGDQSIEAHLDSGSGQGLSLPIKVASNLELEGELVDTGKKARSISGEFPVYQGKLKGTLSFGQYSVEAPTIDFSDVVQRGNLGGRILERFALTLDVKNRRFRMVEAG